MTPAIALVKVSKIYRRYSGRHFATLKSALLQRSILRELRPSETFPALTDVSFTVPKGSTYGVIGPNGSGKSTALKLVAGITKPTSGTVRVAGRISALIELGAGFHPEISGRENVFINGIMLGLTKREIQARFDEIVEFAELRDFIDMPVKTYSSGMYMRLGFAVAIHVDPDVLLVDEVLAVGDEGFTHKCLDKFSEFRRRGKTILLVTHSLNLVERFCDEAIWLDAGIARAQGDPKRVVGAYLTKVEEGEENLLAATTAKAVERAGDERRSASPRGQSSQAMPGGREGTGGGGGAPPLVINDAREPDAAPSDMFQATDGRPSTSSGQPEPPPDMSRAVEGRWGSREIEIVDVALLDRDAQPSFVFHSGDPVSVRVKVRAAQPADDFVFGVGLFNADGVCCYGTNTYLEEMNPARLAGDAEATFVIEGLDLVEGTYKLDVAVHKRDGFPYDYHRLLYTFRVKSRTHDVGIYRPRHRWTFSPNVEFKAANDKS
jgi:ABC-type polysaccharide/polyol phosphate transport system ATPase subunit